MNTTNDDINTLNEMTQEIDRDRANLEFMRPYFERLGPDATVRDVLELIAKEKRDAAKETAE